MNLRLNLAAATLAAAVIAGPAVIIAGPAYAALPAPVADAAPMRYAIEWAAAHAGSFAR